MPVRETVTRPQVASQLAPHLETLLCERCGLVGELPSQLFQLTRLKHLVLARNEELTGVLPDAVGRLTRLDELFCWGTGMNGQLPTTLGECRRLGTAQLFEPYTRALHCKYARWCFAGICFPSFEAALAAYNCNRVERRYAAQSAPGSESAECTRLHVGGAIYGAGSERAAPEARVGGYCAGSAGSESVECTRLHVGGAIYGTPRFSA